MSVLFTRIIAGAIAYLMAELIAIIVWIVHPTFITGMVAWLGLIIGSLILLVAVLTGHLRTRRGK